MYVHEVVPHNAIEGAIACVYAMDPQRYDHIKDAAITPAPSPDRSIRLFPQTSQLWDVLEWTTLAPFWLHGVTWLPWIVYVQMRMVTAWTWGTWCAFIVATAFVWPALEYTLHRFVFHAPVAWACDTRFAGHVNVLRFLVHGIHHAHPKDKRRIVTPLPMSAAFGVLLLLPLSLLVRDRDVALSIACGLVLGFVVYDWTHYFLHADAHPFGEPTATWIRKLKAEHMTHHYGARNAAGESTRNFGVTTRVFDEIFGTDAVTTTATVAAKIQ